MDMKSLLSKIDELAGPIVEAEKEKKLPPWLKKDEDKADEKDEDESEDKEEKVDEAISIQADGAEATSLLDILKLAGQPAPQAMEPPTATVVDVVPQSVEGDLEVDEADADPSYANTPDERVSGMDAATPSGNDLNRKKDQFKHSYRNGDNPMAMEEVKKLEGKLAKMFESMTKE